MARPKVVEVRRVWKRPTSMINVSDNLSTLHDDFFEAIAERRELRAALGDLAKARQAHGLRVSVTSRALTDGPADHGSFLAADISAFDTVAAAGYGDPDFSASLGRVLGLSSRYWRDKVRAVLVPLQP